jgi:hypothetical protein
MLILPRQSSSRVRYTVYQSVSRISVSWTWILGPGYYIDPSLQLTSKGTTHQWDSHHGQTNPLRSMRMYVCQRCHLVAILILFTACPPSTRGWWRSSRQNQCLSKLGKFRMFEPPVGDDQESLQHEVYPRWIYWRRRCTSSDERICDWMGIRCRREHQDPVAFLWSVLSQTWIWKDQPIRDSGWETPTRQHRPHTNHPVRVDPSPGFKNIPAVLGPMARTVEDIEIASRVMFGKSANYSSAPVQYREVKLGRELKFGYYFNDGMARITPACSRAISETVEALRKQGHECVEFELPSRELRTRPSYVLDSSLWMPQPRMHPRCS